MEAFTQLSNYGSSEPSRVLANLVRKFAGDFPGDDLTISQGWRAATLAQPLTLGNDLEGIIQRQKTALMKLSNDSIAHLPVRSIVSSQMRIGGFPTPRIN